MARRKSDLSMADLAPLPPRPVTPRNVTIRWLSRQLVETYGRACAAGDLRIELAALNALAKAAWPEQGGPTPCLCPSRRPRSTCPTMAGIKPAAGPPGGLPVGAGGHRDLRRGGGRRQIVRAADGAAAAYPQGRFLRRVLPALDPRKSAIPAGCGMSPASCTRRWACARRPPRWNGCIPMAAASSWRIWSTTRQSTTGRARRCR